MAKHEINLATFRLLFPAFSSPVKFPDAYITAQWDMATSYIYAWDNCLIEGSNLQNALNLMTAHLLQINETIRAASGGGAAPVVGVFMSATIDKVTVTNQPPPAGNSWQYWLASTPYGLQLWALLKRMAGAGLYVGGLPERRGFRKVYGTFRP